MFLALDAGNSAVKAAVWDGAAWSAASRFPHDAGHAATPQEWAERLAGLAPPGTASGLASVVPDLTEALAVGVRLATGAAPVRVSARLRLPFRMAYATPETLGPDRIAAAAAAFFLGGGRPVVAVDAGTAVTVDVVDVRAGVSAYLGGAIAPGPDLLALALARGTGALPHVSIGDTPVASVGDSTAEAIRTGVAGMFAGGVARLVAEASRGLAARPFVVATGGWAAWLVAHGLPVDAVAETLVLDGVRLLCNPSVAIPHPVSRITDAAGPSRRG